MAVSITVIRAGANNRSSHIADVVATADADITATIPHGLGAIPEEVTLTNLLQVQAGLSLWAVTTIDITNVVCTKSVAVGSGAAGAQLRVIVKRPHSVGR